MEHFPSILLGKYNHHRCLGADAIITVATTVFWPLANIATIITVATTVILAVGQYSIVANSLCDTLTLFSQSQLDTTEQASQWSILAENSEHGLRATRT